MGARLYVPGRFSAGLSVHEEYTHAVVCGRGTLYEIGYDRRCTQETSTKWCWADVLCSLDMTRLSKTNVMYHAHMHCGALPYGMCGVLRVEDPDVHQCKSKASLTCRGTLLHLPPVTLIAKCITRTRVRYVHVPPCYRHRYHGITGCTLCLRAAHARICARAPRGRFPAVQVRR